MSEEVKVQVDADAGVSVQERIHNRLTATNLLLEEAFEPFGEEVTVLSMILYNLMRIADAVERISPPPVEEEV